LAVRSVLSQSHSDLEYIIIDGSSTDGTVDAIVKTIETLEMFNGQGWVQSSKNLRSITSGSTAVHLLSEPDEGLYDALNKGIRMATGDLVGLVHADDFLIRSEVLKHVAETFESTGADAVYGDLQYVREVGGPRAGGGSRKPKFATVRHWRSGAYSRRKLAWGWMPPHPALYLKRTVYGQAMLENGKYFNTSFSCAADYDFMMRVLAVHGVRPVYLPEVLVRMRVGGVSNRSVKHILRKWLEDWQVIRRNRIGHIHTLVWKNAGKGHQFFLR